MVLLHQCLYGIRVASMHRKDLLKGGFGCLELCLYGIRELASAIPRIWPRHRVDQSSSSSSCDIFTAGRSHREDQRSVIFIQWLSVGWLLLVLVWCNCNLGICVYLYWITSCDRKKGNVRVLGAPEQRHTSSTVYCTEGYSLTQHWPTQ